MTDDREVLTTTQLADWLHIHWRTLHRLRENAGLPAYKVGRVYRYDRAAVEQWLREQANPEADKSLST